MPSREALDTLIEAGKHGVFQKVLQQIPAGAIVEVGTIRFPHVTIDGRSTLYWAEHSDRLVYSIDIDPHAIDTAMSELTLRGLSGRVMLIHGDACVPSVWPEIDIALLYLDGGPSPLIAMQAYVLAASHLVPGAIVLVDDCQPWTDHHIPPEWGKPMPEGKGTVLLPYVRSQGIEVTMHKPPEPAPMWLAHFRRVGGAA